MLRCHLLISKVLLDCVGRCENILPRGFLLTQESPRTNTGFIWIRVFYCVGWIHVVWGRRECESRRISLLVISSASFAATQLTCVQSTGWVTPWHAYLLSWLSEWGLSRAPRIRGVGLCHRTCTLDWHSWPERRVAGVCLALLGSPSQDGSWRWSGWKGWKGTAWGASLPVCRAKTQLLFSLTKTEVFPLWAICPILYRGRHKEAIDLEAPS